MSGASKSFFGSEADNLPPWSLSSTYHASKAPSRSTGETSRGTSRGDYTVRSGDTLSGIAERHGTTWQQLYAQNKAVIGGDPDLIVPGQQLAL